MTGHRPTRHARPLTFGAEPRPVKRERKSHIWERDALDFYLETRWTSERLFDMETFTTGEIYDPACGVGRILESAYAAGYDVRGTDIVERGCRFQKTTLDFVRSKTKVSADIVSNPPFTIADEFLQKALELTEHKVAFILPAVWHHGDWRSRILERLPLRRVWNLTPRPSMPPGAAVLNGLIPRGGRHDYAWYVFEHGYKGNAEMRYLHRDRNRT